MIKQLALVLLVLLVGSLAFAADGRYKDPCCEDFFGTCNSMFCCNSGDAWCSCCSSAMGDRSHVLFGCLAAAKGEDSRIECSACSVASSKGSAVVMSGCTEIVGEKSKAFLSCGVTVNGKSSTAMGCCCYSLDTNGTTDSCCCTEYDPVGAQGRQRMAD